MVGLSDHHQGVVRWDDYIIVIVVVRIVIRIIDRVVIVIIVIIIVIAARRILVIVPAAAQNERGREGCEDESHRPEWKGLHAASAIINNLEKS